MGWRGEGIRARGSRSLSHCSQGRHPGESRGDFGPGSGFSEADRWGMFDRNKFEDGPQHRSSTQVLNKLFTRASETLLKKYDSSAPFRHLVSPRLPLNSCPRSRGDSLVLRRATVQHSKAKAGKKCCEWSFYTVYVSPPAKERGHVIIYFCGPSYMDFNKEIKELSFVPNAVIFLVKAERKPGYPIPKVLLLVCL